MKAFPLSRNVLNMRIDKCEKGKNLVPGDRFQRKFPAYHQPETDTDKLCF